MRLSEAVVIEWFFDTLACGSFGIRTQLIVFCCHTLGKYDALMRIHEHDLLKFPFSLGA